MQHIQLVSKVCGNQLYSRISIHQVAALCWNKQLKMALWCLIAKEVVFSAINHF